MFNKKTGLLFVLIFLLLLGLATVSAVDNSTDTSASQGSVDHSQDATSTSTSFIDTSSHSSTTSQSQSASSSLDSSKNIRSSDGSNNAVTNKSSHQTSNYTVSNGGSSTNHGSTIAKNTTSSSAMSTDGSSSSINSNSSVTSNDFNSNTASTSDNLVINSTNNTNSSIYTNTSDDSLLAIDNDTSRMIENTQSSNSFTVTDYEQLSQAFDIINQNLDSGVVQDYTINLTNSGSDYVSTGQLYIHNVAESVCNITIIGNGVVIDGNQDSLFVIDGHTTLNIDNITISGCYANQASVIYISNSSSAIISNSVITDNYAIKNAGVIYNRGNLTLVNSIFRNNSAFDYGGVIHSDKLTNTYIYNCTFVDNHAEDGGVIAIRSGDYDDSTNTTSTLEVYDSNFISNTALSVGGVIFAYNGTNIIINNSNFVRNNAQLGGVFYITNGVTLNVSNSLIRNNSVTSAGGAIYSWYAGNILINNTQMINNDAYYGGVIYSLLSDEFTIIDSDLYDNTAVYGGVLYADYMGEFYLNNSQFINNSAVSGGVIYGYANDENIDFMNLNINSSVFENNRVSEDGGVVYSVADTRIGSSIFTNNDATHGGSIFNQLTMSIEDSLFTENNATSGGAVYSNSTMIIGNSDFDSNEAEIGGAVYNDAVLTVENTTFTDNNAVNGGAIYSVSDMLLENNSFLGNTAEDGGSLYVESSNLVIGNSVLSNSTAINRGGVAYVQDANITIINTTLSNNTADVGGALYNTLTNSLITGSTFINNMAKSGAAIYDDLSDTVIYNSTFSYNNASNQGVLYTTGNLKIINSTISDNNVYMGTVYNRGNLIVVNTTFINNNAKYSGGAITNEGTCVITNSYFINNMAGHITAIVNLGDIILNGNTFIDKYGSLYGTIYSNSELEMTGNVIVTNTTGFTGQEMDIISPIVNTNVTSGDVTFTIYDLLNNEVISLPATINSNGVACAKYTYNAPGSYMVDISYKDIENYIDFYVEIIKKETVITVETVNDKRPTDKIQIIGNLTSNNEALTDVSVDVYVNGIRIGSNMTDENGRYSLDYEVVNGYNGVEVTYDGNIFYEDATAKTSFYGYVLNTTIEAESIENVNINQGVDINFKLLGSDNVPVEYADFKIKVNEKELIQTPVYDTDSQTYSITYVPEDIGEHTVTITHEADEKYNYSYTDLSFEVTQKDVHLTLDYPDDTEVLSSTLINGTLEDNDYLINGTIGVKVNNEDSKIVKIEDGKFQYLFTPQSEGSYNITFDYVDTTSQHKSVSQTITIQSHKINTTLTTDVETAIDQPVTIAVTLTDNQGVQVPDSQVTILVNDDPIEMQNDGYGMFNAIFTPSQTGVYTVDVTYDGSDVYESSDTSTSFTITRRDVEITIDQPTDVKLLQPTAITGTLKSGEEPITGRLAVIINCQESQMITVDDGRINYPFTPESKGTYQIIFGFADTTGEYITASKCITIHVDDDNTTEEVTVKDILESSIDSTVKSTDLDSIKQTPNTSDDTTINGSISNASQYQYKSTLKDSDETRIIITDTNDDKTITTTDTQPSKAISKEVNDLITSEVVDITSTSTRRSCNITQKSDVENHIISKTVNNNIIAYTSVILDNKYNSNYTIRSKIDDIKINKYLSVTRILSDKTKNNIADKITPFTSKKTYTNTINNDSQQHITTTPDVSDTYNILSSNKKSNYDIIYDRTLTRKQGQENTIISTLNDQLKQKQAKDTSNFDKIVRDSNGRSISVTAVNCATTRICSVTNNVKTLRTTQINNKHVDSTYHITYVSNRKMPNPRTIMFGEDFKYNNITFRYTVVHNIKL